MWIVSGKALREFSKRHPRAQAPLRAWRNVALTADWRSFADIRSVYSTVDRVGSCQVFNIAGNKFRLIVRASYRLHKLYILKVITHADYDHLPWIEDCGCHRPPPARKSP